MSGSVEGGGLPGKVREQARDGMERAEAGEAAGMEQIEEAAEADAPETEAIEQEAADGPEGRGLSR